MQYMILCSILAWAGGGLGVVVGRGGNAMRDIIGKIWKIIFHSCFHSSSEAVDFFFAGTSKVTIIPNYKLANHAKVYHREKNKAELLLTGE